MTLTLKVSSMEVRSDHCSILGHWCDAEGKYIATAIIPLPSNFPFTGIGSQLFVTVRQDERVAQDPTYAGIERRMDQKFGLNEIHSVVERVQR